MDSNCKYHKSISYKYEYIPPISFNRAYELECACRIDKPDRDFFIELADIYSDRNINKEYICLEMAGGGSVKERMERLKKTAGFDVRDYIIVEVAGNNIKECNRLIKSAANNSDIYICRSRTDINEMTIFWLRLALYQDDNTGIIFSSPGSIRYDENTIYSPYENIAVSCNESFIIKRKLIDMAGLFDESFENMQYSVFDYCMRILRLGYRNIIAKNSRYDAKDYLLPDSRDERMFFFRWNTYTPGLLKKHSEVHSLIHRKQDEHFSILSAGCGTGSLLSGIKSRYPYSQVIGTEEKEYSFEYGDRLVPYITGGAYEISDYIHTLILCGRERCFDYIILESILEHITDPVDYLKDISRNLSENGKIIVCIPNIMHHSVIAGLLKGDFTYKKSGIVYDGCTHFYTYNEAKRHFFAAGLVIEECFFSIFENENSQKDREIINKLVRIKDVACEVMFNAYEYFFLLKKR